MDSINFVELQAPFPQTETKTFRGRGNTMMTYITARAVMNRLDRVVGPENWRDEYQEVHGGILCTLYLRINGEWVGKSDVGTPPEKIEVVKGMYSDALKRAAVRWGIGRELYKEGTAFEDDDARTIDGDTGEVTRSEARPTTRGERSTHNPPKPSVADELPPAAAEQVAHWTTESGAINKMVAWAREQVWDGIELPHARNRVAKALGVTNFASIAAEYRGTKQEAMAAIQAYVPSDEREDAPAEQPQLVEAPVPADMPQKRRKAG